MNINTRALGAAGLVLLMVCNPAPAAGGGAPPKAPAAAMAGLDRDEEATISLFAAATPSVVFVTTATLHLDQVSLDPMAMPTGTGSGFIWDRRGHVVTNFHVIAGGDASVTLPDHSTWRAKVEIVCCAADVDRLVGSLLAGARTGCQGDGIVFVIPVERAIRIRTAEEGQEVLAA